MTISSTDRKAGPFTGDDASTVFSFAFKVFTSADLLVIKLNTSTGVETTLAITTDYTVSLNVDQNAHPGGTITLTSVLASGYNLTITTALSYLQSLVLTNQGGFYPAVLNAALDRITIFAQQLDEELSRALKYPVSDSDTISATMPAYAQRAGTVLAFDSTGAPVVGPEVDDVGTVLANIANINTVATDIANVNTVAGNTANIDTVAGIDSEITTVAGISADVSTVSGIAANVIAAAANETNINTVAGIDTDITTVAGVAANVTTVAGIDTDVTTVAGIAANVTTVAGVSADVTTVAGISSDVTVAATNVADITNFADVYYGPAASDPTTRKDSSALQDGDLYWSTALHNMRVYNSSSSAWTNAASYVAPTIERFSGNSSDVNFTMSVTPGVAAALIISISGVVQVPGVDYTVSGTTLTFTAAPPTGTSNIAVQYFGNAGYVTADYEVDALITYGSSVNFTKATIDAALTAIGTTNKATLLLRPGTWAITDDLTITSNVTLKCPAGALLDISAGKTLAINGPFEAGLYQVFSGSGTVIFGSGAIKEVYPEWFSGADYGLQINAAIASIKNIGGKVRFTKSVTITTPINATGLTQGMVFEGCGASFDGEATNLMITFKLSTVGFDCSGSNNIHFKDFTIDTDGTTYPKCGFLLARNAAGSGAGEHMFTNVKTNYGAKFSVATVYSYGSEVNTHNGCVFVNSVAGKDTYTITAYNVSNVTSPYITIATGPQSNSTFTFYSTHLYNLGGTNSNLFHLDSAQDFHVYGGIWYNQSASTGGVAGIWIDDANAASNLITVDGVRGEPGANDMNYWLYCDGTSSSTHLNIAITNCRIPVSTKVIFGNNGSKFYGLVYKGNYDANAKGLSLDDFENCDIELNGNALVIGGTATNNTINYGVNGKVRTGQPGFEATKSATTSNVTGDGTVYTVIFDNTVVNQGGDYNAATGVYTAAATGMHHFETTVYLTGLEAGDTMNLFIMTTARTYLVTRSYLGLNETLSMSKSIYMVAGQTAYIAVAVVGGDKDVSVYGGANGYTSFSGCLLF